MCVTSALTLALFLIFLRDEKNFFGRKVAIDAPMSIHQFLIAVHQKDGEMLTNDTGKTTRYG